MQDIDWAMAIAFVMAGGALWLLGDIAGSLRELLRLQRLGTAEGKRAGR
jgi:hypothetical protein